jgi:hypothetical protein
MHPVDAVMADISDITTFLATKVAGIVYPNGTSSPSIAPIFPGFSAPMDVRIFEGWPLPDQLDLDVGGKMLIGTPPQPEPRPNGPVTNISIYPVPGAAAPSIYQLLDQTYVITTPSYGIAISVSGTVVTCSGQPNSGEYLSAIIDRNAVVSSKVAPLSALLADLAAQAVSAGYAATSTATTLTIPYKFQLDVRQGGVGTLGKVSHRQRQGIMVTVWAPNHTARSVIAAAVDNALKQGPGDVSPNGCLKMNLPDGTMALLLPSHTTQTDEQTVVSIYRRDLVYLAEYATLTAFPGYVVTSVQVQITNQYGLGPTYNAPPVNAQT